MQLMSWTMARLGSRFSLLFQPYHRRVLHSGLGRFLDQPLDLMVGLMEPDGTSRTLPFSEHGQPFHHPEQFERLNSITYRGFTQRYGIRFEFNVHSVFCPQDERLCILPAFYLEMRVSPVQRRDAPAPDHETLRQVKLFIRLKRPDTTIVASDRDGGRIDLSYECPLVPPESSEDRLGTASSAGGPVPVRERIVSLNADCQVDEGGRGLTIELPVTEIGSGIKWRLVWAAHCGQPVLWGGARPTEALRPCHFRYTESWADLDAVMAEAIDRRDDWLAHSRWFEKLVEQAPLDQAQRHLIHQGFQNYLSNTLWCSTRDQGTAPQGQFQVRQTSRALHSTVDTEYATSLFCLMLWPQLLALQLQQRSTQAVPHAASGGVTLGHDLESPLDPRNRDQEANKPVEANANFLLLLQAYVHWTGDLGLVRPLGDLVERLARVLLWADPGSSGFPAEGGDTGAATSILVDPGQGLQKTSLAVKRAAGLRAAADLLERCDRSDRARAVREASQEAVARVERSAWMGDHYGTSLDTAAAGVSDGWPGGGLLGVGAAAPGRDTYSIDTANALLLPALIGQPLLLERDRVISDYFSSTRETSTPYGCGLTSTEPEDIRISQNLWRDHLIRYLGRIGPVLTPRYWDLLVMSNTREQSEGFVDAYMNGRYAFDPRGVVSLGFLLARPRLVIDRLAEGGPSISVQPDRNRPQRWPLFALADWKSNKVPVCVVGPSGFVSIEGECDPVTVRSVQVPAGAPGVRAMSAEADS